jgi:predicted phosphohydrolase
MKTVDMFLLIGDIHGLWHDYREIIKTLKPKVSLQLGDFGIGFPNNPKTLSMKDIPGNHLYLRGNHDNPFHCRLDSNYIGDYGIYKGDFIDGRFDKLFYLSGAWSIDQNWRVTVGPKRTWWEDEQLSQKELSDMINLYEKEKPDIVCSHDCPTIILKEFYPDRVIPTRTAQAMDSMLDIHTPSYWFFGHHHKSWRKTINGCTFVCLNELEYLDISQNIFLKEEL